MSGNLKKIKDFWEKNPLYYGEIKEKLGSRKYFEEIKKIFINDLFAGKFDNRIIPKCNKKSAILDLGSGPGLYTRIFYENKFKNIYSADITIAANRIVKKLKKIYKFKNIIVNNENAEKLKYHNNFFDHIHCSGVIHHTARPNECFKEIYRVLKENGTATIGVYYKNFIIRYWGFFRFLLKLISYFRPNILSRGRGNIFKIKNIKTLIKYYDGEKNPKGIAYSKKEILSILSKYFIIECVYLHYFPKRFFKFNIPNFVHFFLDKYLGFMIYVNVRKL